MTERKAKLEPSRRPEDYRGATCRAQEIHDRLKAQAIASPTLRR